MQLTLSTCMRDLHKYHSAPTPAALAYQAGFLTSVIEEFITGRGTLQQIGLLTPNPALCYTLLGVFGGLTAFNAVRTLYRATNKQMTAA